MTLLRVYKDRPSSTWYWACDVPMCVNSGWVVGGHRVALREGLSHLAGHQRAGFGRRPAS